MTTATNVTDFTSQDDDAQMMRAVGEAPDQQLAAFDSPRRPSVTVSIPDQLKTKLAGVSDHVRNSLETALLDQAIADWSALQTTMVQSFGELNTVGPQRFPLENFLRDALESIGIALRSHSMANVASVDVHSAQVSLGLNPRATENLSSPRMMMKLLQIIEKIYSVTLEETNQRRVYVTKIDGIKRDKVQLEEKLKNAPADTVENRAIRSALELDILRMGPQITATEDQITKLDRRVADVAVATGKILNVHYQPEKLSDTVEGFIQAIRDVPTVASRISPKELSRLSGNPSLTFTIELPKIEKFEAVQPATPIVRPPASAKKAPVRTPTKNREVLPKGARLLGKVKLPSGARARIFSGSLDALDRVVGSLRSGSLAVMVYTPPATELDLEKDPVVIAAKEYIDNNRALYADRYERFQGTPLTAGARGTLETYENGGPIFFLNNFPVGVFDKKGAPLPEEDLIAFLQLLYID